MKRVLIISAGCLQHLYNPNSQTTDRTIKLEWEGDPLYPKKKKYFSNVIFRYPKKEYQWVINFIADYTTLVSIDSVLSRHKVTKPYSNQEIT